MHEFEFIEWAKELFGRSAGRNAAPVGIGDDMAVIDFRGSALLAGSDLTIEGVHFDLARAEPAQVGHKALGRCLSDCAAMAAQPVGAIVSVAKPEEMALDTLQEVFRGLARLAERYRCPIVGGDTSRSPRGLVIDVCLFGQCDGNEPVLRSGAKAGDYLYVTGPLGGSILGRHLAFEPRIDQARWMARNLPLHAMIDLSDGLSSDLHHLCRASGVGAELDDERLKKIIAPAARTRAGQTGQSPLDHALHDGEDFELLAAVGLAPQDLPPLPQNLSLIPIGRVTTDPAVYRVNPDGKREKLTPRGFRHF